MDNTINQTCVTSLNLLCSQINSWATTKGWNETPDSVQHKAEQIALMHSELSECLEFVRQKGELACQEHGTFTEQRFGADGLRMCPVCLGPMAYHAMDDHVPTLTGEAAELADVLIRIFHYCGKRDINLGNAVRLKHEYNLTRPYKHGKHI